MVTNKHIYSSFFYQSQFGQYNVIYWHSYQLHVQDYAYSVSVRMIIVTSSLVYLVITKYQERTVTRHVAPD